MESKAGPSSMIGTLGKTEQARDDLAAPSELARSMDMNRVLAEAERAAAALT